MIPSERENYRYSSGSDNPIGLEEKIMFSLLPKEKGKLLDVGCGVGTISLELQKKGFDVHGLDFSSVGVEGAKQKGIKAEVCDLDKSGIPFEDNHFDVVWAGDIVEHLFDPIFMLKEVSRVLKPSGKLLLTTPNDLNLRRRLFIFLFGRSPQSIVYKNFGQCKHHTIFSLDLLEYMLKEAGLNNYSVHSIIRIPILGIKKHCKGKIIGTLLGSEFIVETL